MKIIAKWAFSLFLLATASLSNYGYAQEKPRLRPLNNYKLEAKNKNRAKHSAQPGLDLKDQLQQSTTQVLKVRRNKNQRGRLQAKKVTRFHPDLYSSLVKKKKKLKSIDSAE